jgi:membrane protein
MSWRALRNRILQSLPVRSLRRFGAISGYDRALAIAAQAFVAIVPLLMLAATVTPRADRSGAGSAFVEQFDLTGDAAAAIQHLFERPPNSSEASTVVGVLLLLLSGLSFTRALQRSFEAAWNLTPLGFRGIPNGLVGITVLLTEVILLSTLASLLRGVPAASFVTFALRAAGAVVLWLAIQYLLLGQRVRWGALLPGAVLAAVGQASVMLASGLWMPRVIVSNATRFGLIGVTFALVSWLIVLSVLLVFAAVLSAELAGAPPVSAGARAAGLPSGLAGSRAGVDDADAGRAGAP